MANEVIVVTVRHPDFANETEVFSADRVRTIDLDLGRGFDITKTGPREYDTVLEWAGSHYAEIVDLDAGHPARLHVEAQLEETLAQAGRYETTLASSAVEDSSGWQVFDWAEQTVVADGLDADEAKQRRDVLEQARDLAAEIRLEAARSAC